MDQQAISSACLMIYDELKDDKEFAPDLAAMDEAESDAAIREGIRKGVARIMALGKITLAEDIKSKTAGFAF